MNKALLISNWTNIIITFLAVVLFSYLSLKESKKNKKLYIILLIINLWSFVIYTFFIFPQRNIFNLNNKVKYISQYIEWIVTTPLELMLLVYLSMYRSKVNVKILITIVILDVTAMLFPPIADYSSEYKFLLYGIGFIPMAIIMWFIWNILRQVAKESSSELYTLYLLTAGYLTFFWFFYPAAWLGGPLGLRILSDTSAFIIFHMLNLFTKTGYSLLFLRNINKLE